MLHIRNCSHSGHVSKLALLLLSTASGLILSQPAFASEITVASPVNGTNVASPVWVRAHNVGCDGLTPTAFGFSIDGSSSTIMGVTPFDIDVTRQAISSGTHTIHFKSWTTNGVCPVVNTEFKVGGSSAPVTTPSEPQGSGNSGDVVQSIPSNAVASADLDGFGDWEYEHDAGTPGESRGSSVYPASATGYGDAREFYMTYSHYGGERWHLSFGNDASAENFVYDTYIYVADPYQVQNLEMDLNQVMPNDYTVIYGTQCASGSKTWEYAIISGNKPHWIPSNIYCNPTKWAANSWHHVQIGYHRNSSGVVTHDWINFDGTHSVFKNATAYAALRLGWAKGDLLINYQIDGIESGSGSIKAYIHKMTIYHW